MRKEINSFKEWLQSLTKENFVINKHEYDELYPESFILIPEEIGIQILKDYNLHEEDKQYDGLDYGVFLQIEYHDDTDDFYYGWCDCGGNSEDIGDLIVGTKLESEIKEAFAETLNYEYVL